MRYRPTILLPLAALLVAACSPDATTAPRSTPARRAVVASPGTALSTSILYPYRDELRAASAGLLYTSESDYPFEYVSRAVFLHDTLTVESFRRTFGIARTTPVDVRSLDRFFSRHIENVDPADATALALVPRYQALKDDIQEWFDAPKAYCVGTIQLRCYVVGTTTEGVVAGLATTSIET